MTNSFASMVSAGAAASVPIPKIPKDLTNATSHQATNNTGVHVTRGLPGAVQPELRGVSSSAAAQEDTKGAQALGQDDPDPHHGRAQMVGEAASTTTSASQVCSAVVVSIDLGVMRNELSKQEPTRRYIGASGLSNPCMAYHALTLRGFPGDAPSPQLIRIFNQGHSIETLVVSELRQASHLVEDVNPATGKQWGYSDNGGHHRAHLDGFITLLGGGERMTLEIKSMNRKSFDSFVKKGVKLSHPHYYDQCVDGLQLVMHNGGNETKCLFVVYCKDNSQYHSEIINNDPVRSIELGSKVRDILSGVATRIGAHANEYACSSCFKRTSCWTPNVGPEVRGCWHCEYAEPMSSSIGMTGDKLWFCTIKKHESSQTCDQFKLFRPRKKP